ncbi:MAG: glycosyltransferase [Planctomycetes bacterium]|nr:glycosyltransferase [Planctomycetota bacterium]
MRILHLITELEVGGAETAMALLASGSRGRGHEVEVASLRGPGPIGERLARERIPVHTIGMRGARDAGAIARVRRLLRERRPDILHTHLFHATLVGRLASRGPLARAGPGNGPRVVSTIQVCERERRWHPLLDGLTQSLSDGVVCVSGAVRDWAVRCAGIPRGKCRVIPNPVSIPPGAARLAGGAVASTRRALGVPDGVRLVLTLGRLHRQKGIDILIQAIPDVRRRLPDVFFAIAGDGPEREPLSRLAERWRVADAVRWLGWRADAADLLASADLFCLPSRWEGLPLSILEAFALGVPVVATAADGSAELLRGGETGWPALPEDPIGLAESIVESLTRPEESAARAGRALDLVRREYTVDRVVESHEALYRSVVARRSR